MNNEELMWLFVPKSILLKKTHVCANSVGARSTLLLVILSGGRQEHASSCCSRRIFVGVSPVGVWGWVTLFVFPFFLGGLLRIRHSSIAALADLKVALLRPPEAYQEGDTPPLDSPSSSLTLLTAVRLSDSIPATRGSHPK